jgi:hypothetical protein
MTLPLPNLDDRTYADLVDEARSLIPLEDPRWTDHNPTDTGIILLELLAWITETVLYQVNQVPEQNIATFLNLLNEEDRFKPEEFQTLESEVLQQRIETTILALQKRHRAVTCEDFEQLILEDWNQTRSSEQGRVMRAKCVPRRNLAATNTDDKNRDAPGHVSVVVLTDSSSDLSREIQTFLGDDRRLLTTQVHVVGPVYKNLSLTADLYLMPKANAKTVRDLAFNQIKTFFASVNSSYKGVDFWDGNGWPFGRPVYISEVYQLLDQIPGVDHVREIKLIPEDIEIEQEYELPKLALDFNESLLKVWQWDGSDWKEVKDVE